MSTNLVQPDSSSSWKQEVHLRLAMHRNRRGSIAIQQPEEPVQSWSTASSRAALAAARVAARYAHAPSFSQLQEAEAPAAPRFAATPTASKSAQTPVAQAAVVIPVAPRADAVAPQPAAKPSAPVAALPPVVEEPVVVEVQPAASVRSWEPEAPPIAVVARQSVPEPREPAAAPALPVLHAPPASLDAWENECSQSHWTPDLRLLPITPIPTQAAAYIRQPEVVVPDAEAEAEPEEQPTPVEEFWGIQAVEPDQPIPANLIEFPRELIASRKMRPRRAERAFAEEGSERQLSIFEVDPGPIGLQFGGSAAPALTWPEPEWSGLKLEAPAPAQAEPQQQPAAESEVRLAPIGHRLMAAMVDGALITAGFLGLALVTARFAGEMPSAKIVGFCAVTAFVAIGLLYQAIFLTLSASTPGMRYAGISLCTFDGQIPTPVDLRSRLGALLLSVVPMGLGVAWALFDEDHLCWHDRLSRTYLRSC